MLTLDPYYYIIYFIIIFSKLECLLPKNGPPEVIGQKEKTPLQFCQI